MATREEALDLLRTATDGAAAAFRHGQWEAIDALVNRHARVLLVQRTGWGKSMVYFLATKFFRDAGAGPTLIISPLLALMRDQLLAARRLGLAAETINTTNRDEWGAITAKVVGGETDLLLVSPERLANTKFMEECLLPIADRISFLVVDEAHCISDWGHDFRPDYQRIDRILRQLPPSIAVVATTATANDRVVDDVMAQLGPTTVLQRGSLARSSLHLQNVVLPNRAARLAWLAETLPRFAGSGIVYTLTVRDSERVADWLRSEGIEALAYHGRVDVGDDEGSSRREELEGMLLRNEVKALVATNALGMGFDKPDLGFVVHFQAPQSIVHYYQQVGRAGRAIESAIGVLMGGAEDNDINSYFIGQAFPPERHVLDILQALEDADEGLSPPQLTHEVNLRQGQIEKVLKLLSVVDGAPVAKVGSKWMRTPVPFQIDHDRIERLTSQRQAEWEDMQGYLTSCSCLMEFLGDALDDPDARPCGRCAVCAGAPIVDLRVEQATLERANRFIKRSEIPLEPRRQWQSGAFPRYGWRGNIAAELRSKSGRALSFWKEAGWGEQVDQGKIAGRFSDDLVEACYEMISARWRPEPRPTWVTCVPSLRSAELVANFAARLAARLRLPFAEAVVKVEETERQRNMMNSWQQANNLDGAFAIDPERVQGGPVLLIDDIADSRWSLTVAGALLRQAGAGDVFPLVLALASATSD